MGSGAPAASGAVDEITSPWDGRVVGTVPRAGPADADAAVAVAVEGAAVWRRTPAHERLRILLRAADLGDERTAAVADLISAENGKSIREATVEASRCGDVIRTSAFEGAHLYGESLPLDAAPGTGFDKIGFTVRQPCGVVLAITPFNYPGLLAIHKIAPALAAGNAVVLKPAELTPLTALALADCFLEAGLPGSVLSVVTGHGSEIGDALVADPRVRKVSFTGSTAVGERISRTAGVKKLSLELGSSSPVVILPDADLEVAATAVAAGGYANAGQVCISVQRVITHPGGDRRLPRRARPAREGHPHRRPGGAGHDDGHADQRGRGRPGPAHDRRRGRGRGAGARRRLPRGRGGRADRRRRRRPGLAAAPGGAVRARGGGEHRGATGSRRSRRRTAPPTACRRASSPPTSRARCALSARSTPATSTSTGRRSGAPT